MKITCILLFVIFCTNNLIAQDWERIAEVADVNGMLLSNNGEILYEYKGSPSRYNFYNVLDEEISFDYTVEVERRGQFSQSTDVFVTLTENAEEINVYSNDNGNLSLSQTIEYEYSGQSIYHFYQISGDGSSILVLSNVAWIQNESLENRITKYSLINDEYTFDGTFTYTMGDVYNAGTEFSVSHDGNRVLISSPGPGSNNGLNGETRIYENINGAWSQVGNTITAYADESRVARQDLSADGNRIIMTYLFDDTVAEDAGAARVFEYDNSSWNEIGSFFGEQAFDAMGQRVQISNDGKTIAVQALQNNNIEDSRRAYIEVHEEINGTWSQKGTTFYNPDINRFYFYGFGFTLSEDGQRLGIDNSFDNTDSDYVGTYTVYKFNENLGINNISLLSHSVHPNPNSGNFKIEFKESQESATLNLVDISGRILYTFSITQSSHFTVNETLPAGIYFLTIESGGLSSVEKIIIE